MPHNRKEISQKGIFRRIANLYIDGFRNMTVGRSLWLLVIVKLFIMFAILRTFFFPDFLGSLYDNDEDRADHVRQELLKHNKP